MSIQSGSGLSDVSPPDTAGQLGGATSQQLGAAAFSSETSMASEPPLSGSQAPVSASSPVLTGANSGRPLAIELPELAFDVFVHRSPRLELAHDGERSEANGTERQNRNRNHLKVVHCNISVVQRDG
jgi:hypothetical protein